jgi:hypothetical protein
MTLFATSRQLVVEGATHQSLLKNQQHAQMTSAAILAVVNAVRTKQPLAAQGRVVN